MTALKSGASSLQGSGLAAGDRRRADRIEAEADVGRGGRDAAPFDQRGDDGAGILGLRAEIEVERDAGIEMDAVEHARERRPRSRGEPVAVGADRAGEDEREPGRAVLEIVQRLRHWRRPDRDGRRAA